MNVMEDDLYPTRTSGVPQPLPRRDPVVYHESAPPIDGPLDARVLGQFEEKGFLFLEKVFGDEEITVLRKELDRLVGNEIVRQSEISVTEPASGEIRSIFAVQTVSETFALLARDPRLLGIAQQILGSEVYLHQSRVNMKPGFYGKEFYWHSDFETWHAEDGMPRMRALSCSIALTDNQVLNGPMMLIPGSHKHFVPCTGQTPEAHYRVSLKRQEYGVPGKDVISKLAETHGIEVPTGPAGSVVIFDCNLLHGSNSNITPFPRANAFFVYNSMENTLETPYAAEDERPWFLANREPDMLTPKPFEPTRD